MGIAKNLMKFCKDMENTPYMNFLRLMVELMEQMNDDNIEETQESYKHLCNKYTLLLEVDQELCQVHYILFIIYIILYILYIIYHILYII